MYTSDSEIVQLTVTQACQQIIKAYSAVINGKLPIKTIPSIMLWGPPGIGKSQGVIQIAEGLEKQTGKRVEVTDVRLLLFNPVDLRGIPTVNEDRTLAVWLKPKIFQMDESENCINILFLDELSAAPPSVQASAYQITLDRTVGEHKLPDNCIVIAAGNRVTDKSVAYNMPKALANRLCHIEIICDINSWRDWALKKGLNHMVIGYLTANPSLLMDFDTESNSMAFPTPRTWEMVSNLINSVSDNPYEIFSLIAGCIGMDMAAEFCQWCELYGKMPTIEMILTGKAKTVPARPEVLFAIVKDLVGVADKLENKDELLNLISYSDLLPTEFKYRCFSNLLKNDKLHKYLKMSPQFCEWFEETDHYWEDYDL